MPKNRILITECSGHCRAKYIAVDPFDDLEEGIYCDKGHDSKKVSDVDCERCKNPVLVGQDRESVLFAIAQAICKWDNDNTCDCCNLKKDKDACKCYIYDSDYIKEAEEILKKLLGKE